MTDEDARAALAALIAERRDDYAGLSRLLGRNPAYIQQYVRRGSPRRLAEADRRRLADYFRVPEWQLGGPAGPGEAESCGPVAIPRRPLRAAAGPGALPDREESAGDFHFPPSLLREMGVGRRAALSLIRVEGDSMQPTLAPGDDILVDEDDAADRLRAGIYVLRRDDALLVKRIELNPAGGIDIRSDNETGGSWQNVDPADVQVIGRVIWAGRRVR